MNDIFENTETMKENEHPRFYTAESVMRGHPDKLCDLIADSVLDEAVVTTKYVVPASHFVVLM